MRSFLPTPADLRALARLAAPIATVQVGLMLMGVVDTIVVGHVSATELAAATLGNIYVMLMAVFGMGTLWGLDPIVAQAVGARDHEAVALGIQRGQALALALGLVATAACIPAGAVFALLRQPPEVVPRAAAFVHMSAAGLVPMMLFVATRQSLQAMKHTRPIVLTIVAANVLNLAANLVFVFGRFGVPAMGSTGSALANTLSRGFMFGMLLLLAWGRLGPLLRPARREAFAPGPVLRTLRIGLPVAIQTSIEYTTFGAISVLAGWFGAEAIGGHQVALNLSSLTFMVPAGVGAAASVLVGHAIGEGDMPHARRIAASALLLGAGFMACCALVFLLAPSPFAHLYTSVPGVLALAIALIPIAGVFQVFDGLQAVAAGILRGAGDTRAAMLSNVLGFWLIGTPVSIALGFGAKMGVIGLWWGFVAGLAAVATFLVLRVRVRLGGAIERVRVESSAG
jgi:MATE family multidrug resistance protein